MKQGVLNEKLRTLFEVLRDAEVADGENWDSGMSSLLTDDSS